MFLCRHLDAEDLSETVGQLRLKEAQIAIAPVNDNDDVEIANGGCHWSLLVLDIPQRRAFHVDSAKHRNHNAAKDVARRLLEAVANDSAEGDGSSDLAIAFEMCRTPQQQNAFDCGAYILAHAEAIATEVAGDGLLTAGNHENCLSRARLETVIATKAPSPTHVRRALQDLARREWDR